MRLTMPFSGLLFPNDCRLLGDSTETSVLVPSVAFGSYFTGLVRQKIIKTLNREVIVAIDSSLEIFYAKLYI